ncbi:MAG: hypothetical protein MTP17_00150 [Candidatus Midichloria sp.]|nr:MAG: hypothetical protein MTP17_03530 [Candidatus Midichloria sp.]WHQ46808.1 MAG: hypothetical protein MTP17_00150 [Candidatus Midichloria sp.]
MADFIRLKTGKDIKNRYSVYGLNYSKSAPSWNESILKKEVGKVQVGT